MAATFSLLEEFAGDNADLVRLASEAITALDNGDAAELREILERMARPKWLSKVECQGQYEMEIAQ